MVSYIFWVTILSLDLGQNDGIEVNDFYLDVAFDSGEVLIRV